ncbi:hypothetical protein PHJA_001671300 [Phtheirospermum japonicum]|uniref:Uncharacterized protein n=1 Tax=Phtheirospermum japonicum TaxID=374723 RepID=A0A830C6P9_9LAMI|nr:hypothetical protein PHJA_001671300 [Phtheirospermum japonicum]
MGSVVGEVESQPSISNCNKYKLPRTLLAGCGAVNHASVPRKLRSGNWDAAVKEESTKTAQKKSFLSPPVVLQICWIQKHNLSNHNLPAVPASESQYDDNYYPMDDKYNGLFQSQTGTQSSETQRSCQRTVIPLLTNMVTIQPQQHSSSTVNNGSFTAQMGFQQQKRADQLWAQYNTVGVGSSHLPDWRNGKSDSSSTHVNCAQALFPHLLGSTYQQFIPPPQQQQLMSIDSSSSLPIVKMNQHRQFPLGFERNGGPAFYYGNAQQFLR